jgi:hypothetical protein
LVRIAAVLELLEVSLDPPQAASAIAATVSSANVLDRVLILLMREGTTVVDNGYITRAKPVSEINRSLGTASVESGGQSQSKFGPSRRRLRLPCATILKVLCCLRARTRGASFEFF